MVTAELVAGAWSFICGPAECWQPFQKYPNKSLKEFQMEFVPYEQCILQRNSPLVKFESQVLILGLDSWGIVRWYSKV